MSRVQCLYVATVVVPAKPIYIYIYDIGVIPFRFTGVLTNVFVPLNYFVLYKILLYIYIYIKYIIISLYILSYNYAVYIR